MPPNSMKKENYLPVSVLMTVAVISPPKARIGAAPASLKMLATMQATAIAATTANVASTHVRSWFDSALTSRPIVRLRGLLDGVVEVAVERAHGGIGDDGDFRLGHGDGARLQRQSCLRDGPGV